MKIKRPKNRIEKQIATAAIVSTEFLQRIHQVYKPEYTKTDFVRVVMDWCLEYWQQYNKAPQEDIEEIWRNKSDSLEEATADLLGKFLDGLSEEYEKQEKFNVGYVFDQAVKYFRTRSLRLLQEQIGESISGNRVEDAEQALEEYMRVSPNLDQSKDPFADTELICRAFESSQEPLFRLKGDFGYLLRDQLVRGGFIGFQGPEKRGKSWVLLELAFQAITQKCNVAFFSCGDMSEEEITRRLQIRLAGRSDRQRYCGEIKVPCADCVLNQMDECTRPKRTCDIGLGDAEPDEQNAPAEYEPCSFCRGKSGCYQPSVFWKQEHIAEPLSWKEAAKLSRQFARRRKKKRMRVAFHPNSTLTVAQIGQQLHQWSTFEGWVPDVVVVDYADIMDTEPGVREFRHAENEKWKRLRSLGQVWNVCLITATQADAASYDRYRQTLKNFSEDKRKYGHVTAFYALNQTEAEKVRGLLRVGVLLLREDDFNPQQEVTLMSCLSKGRIHMDSLVIHKARQEKQEQEEEQD